MRLERPSWRQQSIPSSHTTAPRCATHSYARTVATLPRNRLQRKAKAAAAGRPLTLQEKIEKGFRENADRLRNPGLLKHPAVSKAGVSARRVYPVLPDLTAFARSEATAQSFHVSFSSRAYSERGQIRKMRGLRRSVLHGAKTDEEAVGLYLPGDGARGADADAQGEAYTLYVLCGLGLPLTNDRAYNAATAATTLSHTTTPNPVLIQPNPP